MTISDIKKNNNIIVILTMNMKYNKLVMMI